jgi:DNA (cytosine-5)-methyltransferase 1
MKAISLFTGAGGLDLGFEAAGFRTVAAVEQNEVARQTLLINRDAFFPDLSADAIRADVVTLNVKELLAEAGVRPGEIDLLHGGPPCTPFSKSGYWLEYKRLGADPKASLLDSYVDVLAEAQPRAFLMENVYALGYRNHNQPVFERFQQGVKDAGYTFDFKVVLAADHGVPQLRQRLICVGLRLDEVDGDPSDWAFGWPAETHAGPHETRRGWDEQLLPHVSVGRALEGLSSEANPPEEGEVADGTYSEELQAVPPGDNYLFWTEKRGHLAPRFEWRSRYWSFLLKLHPDRPSPTIQGQPGPWVGPFHWESRRLRVAELKRLMTFPDEFFVSGTRRDRQLQLGNAVPPSLARVLGEALARTLEPARATGDLMVVV